MYVSENKKNDRVRAVFIGIVWESANERKHSRKITDPVSRVNILWANKLEVKSERQAEKRKKRIARAAGARKMANKGYCFCNGKSS